MLATSAVPRASSISSCMVQRMRLSSVVFIISRRASRAASRSSVLAMNCRALGRSSLSVRASTALAVGRAKLTEVIGLASAQRFT